MIRTLLGVAPLLLPVHAAVDFSAYRGFKPGGDLVAGRWEDVGNSFNLVHSGDGATDALVMSQNKQEARRAL